MAAAVSVRPIRVAVTHGDAFLAAGISAVLADEPGIAACGPLGPWPADVIVADHATGLRLARRAGPARRAMPALLVVSEHDGAWHVRQALEAGVAGYLPWDCSTDELVAGVRSLARGERCLPDRLAHRLADGLGPQMPTERELAVLRHVAVGLANKEVARCLGISVHTVKSHVRALFDKLGAATRTGVVAQARRRGLLRDAGLDPAAR